MSLIRLKINAFRNIDSAQLLPGTGLNLIYGQNGSGKTSILEAIYFLGMGRSFRSHLSARVINIDAEQLTVFAVLEQAGRETKVGFRRSRNGDTEVRINGDKV